MKENKILATVNGKEITEEYLNMVMQSMGPQRAMQYSSEQGKKQLLNDLINEELLYFHAKDNRMDTEEAFQKELQQMEANLLKQYALGKLLESVEINDEEVKSYYEDNKEQFKTPESVKASHILVDTEEKANEILNEINEGLSFEEAAKKYSKCPSKAKGGDLGFFTKGKMVPEFEQAAFDMEKDDISEPVKTKFGYHLIKVYDKKEPGISTFEEVKNNLAQNILANKQRQKYLNKVNQLKKEYEVKICE